MKYYGSISDFTEQRNEELIATYRSICQKHKQIDLKKISVEIVNTPCSRFWISEERATMVISAMLRHQPILNSMRPLKRELFLEVFKRVMALKEEHPDWKLYDLVFDVVNSPAPKFYMKPRTAMEYIWKIRKGNHAKHRRPLAQ